MAAERLRFSIAQAAPSFVGGIYIPFFPVWLAYHGITPAQTSVILASAMFVRVFVSPAAGIIGDALGDRRSVAMACTALAGIGFALLSWLGPVAGFAAILPLVLIAVPLNGASGPIVEAVTTRGAIDYKFDYARVRLWGSLAFVVSNYLAGVIIGVTGPGLVAWMLTASIFGCLIAFLPMPPLLSDQRVVKRSARRAVARTFAETRVLLRQPIFLLFLAGSACAQGAHAAYYAFGALIFRGQGFSDDYIGLLWAVGTLAEVVLFAFSPQIMRRIGATGLMALGSALAMLRWIGMAFDTGPVGAMILQLFHAASFGLVHLGAMKFIVTAVPVRLAATEQSIFAVAVYGVGMGLFTLAIGQLYGAIGAYVYFGMAILSADAFVLSLVLARVWHGRNLFAFSTLTRSVTP